jgi:hypothetical protein
VLVASWASRLTFGVNDVTQEIYGVLNLFLDITVHLSALCYYSV